MPVRRGRLLFVPFEATPLGRQVTALQNISTGSMSKINHVAQAPSNQMPRLAFG